MTISDEHEAGLEPDARTRFRRALHILEAPDATAEGQKALADLTAARPVEVASPARWVPWVDAARRAWSGAGRAPWIAGLPPCLQMTRRPMWPREPAAALRDVPCAAARACPAERCPHADSDPEGASPLRPLRHGTVLGGVHAAIEGISRLWGHGPPPVVTDWLNAMCAGSGSIHRPDRFEFSVKRTGDRLVPRLRVVDLGDGAPDAARWGRIVDWLDTQVGDDVAASTRAFLALFESHHGSSAGLSVGLEAPLDGGPPRLQLYAHQRSDRRVSRAHLLSTLRWSGADAHDLARMAAFIDTRSVALVVFAPTADDPRGVKVYVSAPFDTDAPGLGLPPLTPPSYAADSSLVVWRCGKRGLEWEKRDFRTVTHPQRSGVVVADFVKGLAPDDHRRASSLFDGRLFLPWFTWISVRPGVRTLYFHAC